MPLTNDEIKKIAKEIIKDMELRRWIKQTQDEELAKKEEAKREREAKKKVDDEAKEAVKERVRYFECFDKFELLDDVINDYQRNDDSSECGHDYCEDHKKYNMEEYIRYKKFVDDVVIPFLGSNTQKN